MTDLSIVIVNWNTSALLKGCLRSIYGQSDGPSLEVLVVDNASSDDSVAMVRREFGHVRLIESPTNLGFAAGNNLAFPLAEGAHVLLLNPDTVLTEGSLSTLVDVAQAHPKAAIAGAQLLNADGSLQASFGIYPSVWSEIPLVKGLAERIARLRLGRNRDADPSVRPVDWVSGACLLIRQEALRAIGPLDESYWLYTEETDWCYRARRAGWEVLLVPSARVYHLARAASGQRFVFSMLHFYQSRVRFARKHYGAAHAAALQRLYRLKALMWQRQPERSPLHKAYADLSDEQIRKAYGTLRRALASPLTTYLESSWS
ncbi:MAG: glycosyltransferase family 2 protein [Anaerolineae bacterium]|jgi:N-acetylglucosaminyl-diphospho-decaprenol L-rhamnosyltransferase